MRIPLAKYIVTVICEHDSFYWIISKWIGKMDLFGAV